MSTMKRKIKKKEITIGSWITLAHPAIAEIMASEGFDWLVIDLEHSVISLREAEELIRVIERHGVVPLVRLSSNDSVQIKRVMDAGAQGVIVPMVNSRDDALAAVEAVHYPPLGSRGVGLARAQKYGADFEGYREWLKKESIVIVQVEHIESVNNLDKILSVEGVDGFLVGPYDLSGSLGIPGEFEHSEMIRAFNKIQEISSGYNGAIGFHVVPPNHELVIEKISKGYTFIAFGTDFIFLGEKCRDELRGLHSRLASR